jgi:hypothetical protein
MAFRHDSTKTLLIKCADLAQRHKGKVAATVFSLSITIPLFFFTNSASLLDKDKNFRQWAIDNGLWGERGVKVVVAWLVSSALLSLIVYGVLFLIGRAIERHKLNGRDGQRDRKDSLMDSKITPVNTRPYTFQWQTMAQAAFDVWRQDQHCDRRASE